MNQELNSPIDLKQLNQISDGDIEFEIEVLRVYIEDVVERIGKIRKEITTNDRSQIMREAHHIKGASSNVGAWQIQALAMQIEKLDQYQLEEATEIIDDMLKKMKAVEQFIEEKSATLSSSCS